MHMKILIDWQQWVDYVEQDYSTLFVGVPVYRLHSGGVWNLSTNLFN